MCVCVVCSPDMESGSIPDSFRPQLHLTHLKYTDRGEYFCVARNSLGTDRSKPLLLNVTCKFVWCFSLLSPRHGLYKPMLGLGVCFYLRSCCVNLPKVSLGQTDDATTFILNWSHNVNILSCGLSTNEEVIQTQTAF